MEADFPKQLKTATRLTMAMDIWVQLGAPLAQASDGTIRYLDWIEHLTTLPTPFGGPGEEHTRWLPLALFPRFCLSPSACLSISPSRLSFCAFVPISSPLKLSRRLRGKPAMDSLRFLPHIWDPSNCDTLQERLRGEGLSPRSAAVRPLPPVSDSHKGTRNCLGSIGQCRQYLTFIATDTDKGKQRHETNPASTLLALDTRACILAIGFDAYNQTDATSRAHT